MFGKAQGNQPAGVVQETQVLLTLVTLMISKIITTNIS